MVVDADDQVVRQVVPITPFKALRHTIADVWHNVNELHNNQTCDYCHTRGLRRGFYVQAGGVTAMAHSLVRCHECFRRGTPGR